MVYGSRSDGKDRPDVEVLAEQERILKNHSRMIKRIYVQSSKEEQERIKEKYQVKNLSHTHKRVEGVNPK